MEPTPVRYFLERLAKEGPAFVVQIGANDGVSGDPLRDFIQRYHWAGILVEPLSDIFATLKQNYGESPHIKLENCAIGHDGELILYRVRPDVGYGPSWLHQLASFDRQIVLQHASQFPDIADYVIEERVPSISFSALMDRHGVDQFDALVTDTEGYDLEILKQVDFSRYRPRIVFYEHKHLSREKQDEARALLAGLGYVMLEDEDDTLALKQEWVDTGAPVEVHEVIARLEEKLREARRLGALLRRGGVFRVTAKPDGDLVVSRIGTG